MELVKRTREAPDEVFITMEKENFAIVAKDGLTDPEGANPKHPKDVKSHLPLGTDPYTKLGTIAGTTGGIGLGKLLSA